MRMVLIMAASILTSTATAAVQSKPVNYEFGGVTLKGHLFWDDATTGKRPGILVVHEFWGLNDYAKKRAEMLAQLGYVAMAVDMFGEGKVTKHPNEASAMAGEVRANLQAWQGRAQAAMKVLQAHEKVDSAKIGAIGYCFGGSTALQLAMSGANVSAVVSFHGALPPITTDQARAIKAKILICHGADDTFIAEKDCQDFRSTLNKAGVDYQFHYFGGVKHSFTVPHAEDAGVGGLQYNEAADKRSWQMMQDLFKDAFSK